MLCNYALSEPLRGAVYSSLVLTILLYGSEVWCLREDLFAKLRTFQNSCCRAMCRITMAHTIRHHIPSKQLYKRLGIAPVDQYYHRRLLTRVAHAHAPDSTSAAYRLRREPPANRASADDVGAHLEEGADQVWPAP